MSSGDQELLSTVFYYLREGYPNHGRISIQNGMKRHPHDNVLKFHLAMIFAMEGNLQEATKRFGEFKDNEEFYLASVIALVNAHKMCPEVDTEAVKELEAKTRELRRHASYMTLYYAALVLFYFRKYEKAREYVERALKGNLLCTEVLNLNGWIDMLLKDENSQKKAIRYFEGSTGEEEAVNIECQMGKVTYFQLSRSYSAAFDIVNILIVNFPKYIPAIITKMHLQLTSLDWEQAMDTSQRCLTLDSNCVEALRYQVLHALCHSGSLAEARKAINELMRALDDSEPNCAEQYYITSKYFASLCARDTVILQKLLQLAERAVSLEPRNQHYAINVGRILLLQGHPKDASKHFLSALEVPETSVVALQGMVQCQLAQDNLKEASTQLEFLNELQHTIGKSAELSYLAAVLSRKQSTASQKILTKLDEATDLHLKSLEGIARGLQYYEHLNPDFLIQLVLEYLAQSPQQPPGMASVSLDTTFGGLESIRRPEDGPLTRCLRILETMIAAAPGYQKALYLLSYVYYLLGDSMTALTNVKNCLELDATLVEGHILSAQIYLYQGNLKMAEQALETGLSNNFEVRNHPLYQLVRARLMIKQGNAKVAVQILKQAISSLNNSQPSRSHKRAGDDIAFGVNKAASMSDRLTLSLELAEAHRVLGETHEATKVLQDAQLTYAGSNELGRITIASADLALSQGDHESALATLRTIRPEHPYFLIARQHMANIYLHHRKEKKLYAACYRELAEKLGTTEAHLLLGDALMTIQEPERAMEVYEAVLRKNPNDIRLAAKMGQALVKTHQYAKAVSYYEAAVKGGQPALRLDLAELLVKLKQYEKAKRVLTAMITEKNDANSLEPNEVRRTLQLLSDMCEMEQANIDEHIELLSQARSMQSRRLNRMQTNESGDAIIEQRLIVADVCLQLAFLNEKQYRTLSSEKSLNSKEKVRPKDELAKGDRTTTMTINSGPPTKYVENALTLCQDCLEQVAAIVGKKNVAESHQPLSLGLIRSLRGEETNQLQLMAIQLEIKALAQLASLKLLESDYTSCEQQALKLAQIQEEVEAYQNEAHSDSTPNGDQSRQTNVVTEHSGIDVHRLLDGIKSASLLLAEVSYNKGDFDVSAKHLENVMQKCPTDYLTLSFLVETLRRAGQLNRAVDLVEKARALDARGNGSAGYNFCRGLCYWFTGESSMALQHFNRARVDSDYAEEAIYRMVDICLSTEYQGVNGQSMETGQITNNSNTVNTGPNTMSTTTFDDGSKVRGYEVAEKLLNELRVVKNRKKHLHRINMVLVATGSKPKVEAVLETFARMAQEDPDNYSLIYGAAACYMALNQAQKARNQLKRLAKVPWNAQDSEELEQSWLLLADIYIQIGKTDLAHELLKRSLQYNKSCTKAYEFMGYVMEKEQNFQEAVRNYELAWINSNKKNPSVGYKLAHTCLKVRQLIEAIEVCLQVLAVYPNYPKIRKDVLDKARLHLRT